MSIRIKSIEVKNFKSLVDFHLDLAKFSCLIGLNGSGKSTVLQFMDFLAQLVRGGMSGWLKQRHWQRSELTSSLSSKRVIKFCARFEDHKGRPVGSWEATYDPDANRCTKETISLEDSVLETTDHEVKIQYPGKGSKSSEITFSYRGSILSSLKEDLLPPLILNCKRFFLQTESLELLTPERLRHRTREAQGSLGHGGLNLSAFIYELDPKELAALVEKLKSKYLQLERVYAWPIPSGWKELRIREKFDNASIRTKAAHVNDGLLRVIAILAELASAHDLLLFDEIENGINPELVEFVTDALVKARQQVLVTTHSPMILNYLDDDVARKGVIYLYRTRQGHTKSIPFFSIPSLREKLAVMGPGEAFADTNLTELAAEIATMGKEEAQHVLPP
jgi:predicted ATPase